MNRRLLWIAAIMWIAATFILFRAPDQAPADLPSHEVMMQQAQELEAAAGDDQDLLRRAMDGYNTIANNKAYAGTEIAAEARLRVGILQETKLIQQSNRVAQWFGAPKYKNEMQRQNAVHTYKELLKKYDPEESEAAAEGEDRYLALKQDIDDSNTGHFLYRFLDTFVQATGANPKYSYALALLLITIIFKALTIPLSNLQFKYMREMQRIQPLVKQLQEKYKNNQKEFGPKVMELYKEHGVNPFSSCLPVLVQLPVLYLLFLMVRLYEFQFKNAEFLWIGSGLADRFPNLVGSSLAQVDIPLLILYTISMFISQRLTIVDPTQAEQQKIMAYTMPLLFGVMFWMWGFPSAFMLYWLFFNIVSTTHQYFALRRPAVANGPSIAGQIGPVVEALPTDETYKQPETPKKQASTSPGKAKRRRKKR